MKGESERAGGWQYNYWTAMKIDSRFEVLHLEIVSTFVCFALIIFGCISVGVGWGRLNSKHSFGWCAWERELEAESGGHGRHFGNLSCLWRTVTLREQRKLVRINDL